MMMLTKLCLLASTMLAAASAAAAIVDDPVPGPPAPGLTLAIQPFVSIPPSAGSAPAARIQYVTPVRDGTGRLFVNDTRGVLWMTSTAGAAPTRYLDLRGAGIGFTEPGSEGGLIGVAFHPNFNGDPARPGFGTFYTHYTATQASGVATYLENDNASHESVIREWTVSNPGGATPNVTSSREVLRVGHFAANHNGGTIAFNPAAAVGSADYGKLYIGFGDGGGGNDPRDNGQDRLNPLGKILRIDPLAAGPNGYGIPADNPFAGQSGTLGEIWALGLRNPQQFSWDTGGRMFISDIGQAQLEEVNLGVAGANYGWPAREGTFAKDPNKNNFNVYTLPVDDATFGFTYPIAQYDHDEGAAIGGGFLYEGNLIPALRGMFLLTDNPTGRLFYFSPADALAGGTAPLRELLLTLNGNPYTFLSGEGYAGRVDLRLGIDADNELYLLTKKDGDIFRFLPTAAAVPEPATWALLTLGVGGMGWRLRRRRVAMIAA